MCTIFDYSVINHLSCPLASHFPRRSPNPHGSSAGRALTLVVGRPHLQGAAAFDLYIQPSILYLISTFSVLHITTSTQPPFHAHVLVSVCASARPVPALCFFGHIPNGRRRAFSRLMKRIYPNSLAKAWLQAPHPR